MLHSNAIVDVTKVQVLTEITTEEARFIPPILEKFSSHTSPAYLSVLNLHSFKFEEGKTLSSRR